MIRAFTTEPLAAGTTERLLKAANRAPSAGFSQGYAQFGVPDQWTPIGAIAIGHPDPASDPVPPARSSDRKSLAELVHHGRW